MKDFFVDNVHSTIVSLKMATFQYEAAFSSHFHVKKQANIGFVNTENDYFLEMYATKSNTLMKMELKIRTK